MAVSGVIELGGFDFHFVHPALRGGLQQIGELVFVGSHNEELPDQMRSPTLLTFGLHHVAGALHHFGQRTTDAVGRVGLLRQTVDGDDEAAEPGVDEGVAFGFGQVMGIGGRGAVDAVPMALGNELVELGVEQGFALEVQVHIGQPRREFVDPAARVVHVQHAGWTCEGTQSTGAFGAPEVARGGGLDRQRRGHDVGWHLGLARPLRRAVTHGELKEVDRLSRRQHTHPRPSVHDLGPPSHSRKVRSRYLRRDDPDWGHAAERRFV